MIVKGTSECAPKNIGITGSSGFIGYHLTNYLLQKGFKVISINKKDFSNNEALYEALKICDTVVHLAGMNRGLENEVYECNIELAWQIKNTLQQANLTPAIIFASSIQEKMDNPYGRSKKEITDLFVDWAKSNNARFTSLILPNIFGPFCKPFYNSVVATFSYQLTHNQEPSIQIDAPLRLIYINDLVEKIHHCIITPTDDSRVYLQPEKEILVSQVLSLFKVFKTLYLSKHIIPNLNDSFDLKLFNTFRSYLDSFYFPVKVVVQSDERGNLVEAVKEGTGGQVFYSLTKPKQTRGNHFHRRKIERFFVVRGQALIKMRKVGSQEVIEYNLTGEQPSFVDIPIFYTHNISNVGNEDLITIFWTNEIFNSEDTDTFPEKV